VLLQPIRPDLICAGPSMHILGTGFASRYPNRIISTLTTRSGGLLIAVRTTGEDRGVKLIGSTSALRVREQWTTERS